MTPSDPHQLRVMLVDDDPSWRRVGPEVLGGALWEAGLAAAFEVHEDTLSARRALRDAPNGTYDVLITDMFFPPPDKPEAPRDQYQAYGSDILPRARAAGVASVIAYTDHDVAVPQMRKEAREGGADFFCMRRDFTARDGENVLDEVVALIKKENSVPPDENLIVNTRDVAVVHGANDPARRAMFAFLAALDLNPVEFEEAIGWTGTGSPAISDVLSKLFSRTQAVVVLLTPDEQVRLRPGLAKARGSDEAGLQARPNVYFEAGMALASNPDRTVIVRLGRTREASDLAGLHALVLDDEPHTRERLAKRLERAGCPVKRTERMMTDPAKFLDALPDDGA